MAAGSALITRKYVKSALLYGTRGRKPGRGRRAMSQTCVRRVENRSPVSNSNGSVRVHQPVRELDTFASHGGERRHGALAQDMRRSRLRIKQAEILHGGPVLEGILIRQPCDAVIAGHVHVHARPPG